jgi:hypothetical protein
VTTLNGHGHDDAAMNGFGLNGSSPASQEPDLVAQRMDLERELEAVQAEVAELRTRVTERDAALKAALREELIASRERLTTMEAEHQRTIDDIRADAQRQVEQIIADAQREIGELS